MVNQNKQAATVKQKRRGRVRSKNRTVVGTKQRSGETDGIYIFKLVVVALVSTMWLKFAAPTVVMGVITLTALPLGLIVTLIGVRVIEKDAFERRIWYAVALVIGILTYFVPAGIVI